MWQSATLSIRRCISIRHPSRRAPALAAGAPQDDVKSMIFGFARGCHCERSDAISCCFALIGSRLLRRGVYPRATRSVDRGLLAMAIIRHLTPIGQAPIFSVMKTRMTFRDLIARFQTEDDCKAFL